MSTPNARQQNDILATKVEEEGQIYKGGILLVVISRYLTYSRMPSVTRSRADTISMFLALLSFSATTFSAPTVDNCVRPSNNTTHTRTRIRRICHANSTETLSGAYLSVGEHNESEQIGAKPGSQPAVKAFRFTNRRTGWGGVCSVYWKCSGGEKDVDASLAFHSRSIISSRRASA